MSIEQFKSEFLPCLYSFYSFENEEDKAEFYKSQWEKISDDSFPEWLANEVPSNEILSMYYMFVKAGLNIELPLEG